MHGPVLTSYVVQSAHNFFNFCLCKINPNTKRTKWNVLETEKNENKNKDIFLWIVFNSSPTATQKL